MEDRATTLVSLSAVSRIHTFAVRPKLNLYSLFSITVSIILWCKQFDLVCFILAMSIFFFYQNNLCHCKILFNSVLLRGVVTSPLIALKIRLQELSNAVSTDAFLPRLLYELSIADVARFKKPFTIAIFQVFSPLFCTKSTFSGQVPYIVTCTKNPTAEVCQ